MVKNEQDRYTNLLSQMSMPKSIKAGMTLWGFSIIDIGSLFVGFFLGSGISNLLHPQPIMTFVIYGVSVIVTIALIARTPWQPGIRNIKVLFSVLAQDRHHYYPIRIAEKRKKER